MSDPAPEPIAVPAKPKRMSAAHVVSALSLIPVVPLAIVYLLRPESCAAITVWPVWVWALPPLVVLLFCFRRKRSKPVWIGVMTWVVFVLLLAEEPRSLMRFNRLDSQEWRAAKVHGRGFRVVSLNCAGGSVEAMDEVADYRPDVVLLQESPPKDQVEAFGRRLFGKGAGVIVGFDASLITRGAVEPARLSLGQRAYFVRGTAHLVGGPTVEVVSLRLTPACVCTELLSPSCWRAHVENHEVRRGQLKVVADTLFAGKNQNPIVLGGDFNAPQDDGVFDLLRARLRDSFKSAGALWGNTITNDMPVLRIDQIWNSGELRAVAVVAHKTVNSDHRMVVGDFVLAPSAGK